MLCFLESISSSETLEFVLEDLVLEGYVVLLVAETRGDAPFDSP